MTMNINRLVQNTYRQVAESKDYFYGRDVMEILPHITEAVKQQVHKLHCYLNAFNTIVLDMKNNHMIPIYDAGFIAPEKQYLTCGVNGLVEGAEFLGIDISDNEEYAAYVNAIMSPIFEANKAAKTKDIMFNTEMVPKQTKSSGHLKPLLIDLELP